VRKGHDARQAHLVFCYANHNAIVQIAASPPCLTGRQTALRIYRRRDVDW